MATMIRRDGQAGRARASYLAETNYTWVVNDFISILTTSTVALHQYIAPRNVNKPHTTLIGRFSVKTIRG